MNMWPHYHSEGCSVNFEHFPTDVKLTTSTKAAPSVSILSAASPPAAHELTSLEPHTALPAGGVTIIRALAYTYHVYVTQKRVRYVTYTHTCT